MLLRSAIVYLLTFLADLLVTIVVDGYNLDVGKTKGKFNWPGFSRLY